MFTVLFACVHDAGWPHMAAALFNLLADRGAARALSVSMVPATLMPPALIETMKEIAVDLSACRSQPLTTALANEAQLLVTIGGGDAYPCLVSVPRDHWPIDDAETLSLEAVRAVRDQVRARVEQLIGAIGAVRVWPTAPTLETDRLALRPLALSDADEIQAIFPKWETVRYLSTVIPWPYPADGAATFIRDHGLPAMARRDEWTWAIRLRGDTDPLIGLITLMRRTNDHRGFWLDTTWQGRGLMTEAAHAVTGFWFDVLGFSVLRVPKAIANIASRRISEKQGMRLIGGETRDYVSGRLPAELWEITASEWRAQKRVS